MTAQESATVARTVIAPRSAPTPAAGRTDAVSTEWLRRLRSSGPERESALAELRAVLLRAAGFEVHRRRGLQPGLRGGDLQDIVEQSADDALVSILRKLDSFRGDSRFTTWAYKFALYEAAANMRKLAWQGREIPVADEDWALIADRSQAPERGAEMAELLAAIREEIATALSPHQREVLVALALNEVPIDVLAERLNTTRGALYKTLHDARRKLRTSLTARGMAVDAYEGGTA